ncbi:hypothetical protein [Rhodoblastus sp.]|uniref:hypothetical protein n=1 Tax=Rhodoblastus sp. TaxID=1962975 RepID=UPI003F987C3F
MKLRAIYDELALRFRETADQADALERAIERKHVRRPMTDVSAMRFRFPEFLAAIRAIETTIVWRDRLPRQFIAELEEDPKNKGRS